MKLILFMAALLAIGCEKETSFEKKCKVCTVQTRTWKATSTICGKDTSVIIIMGVSDSVYNNCK